MIDKIVFNAFEKDRLDWFEEHDCTINSIESNLYEGRLTFFVYSPNRTYPFDETSTEVYPIDFDRSNHYGIQLPCQYVKTYMRIMRWGHLAHHYRVAYTSIVVYEEPPLMFQDLAIYFKPYSIKDCAHMFAQFLQWDYHGVVSIRDIDTKYNLLTLDIDADLVPITNYFTVVNLPSTPSLEFTFKRIDKSKQLVGDCLTCTYQLMKVRTTIFDEVSSEKDDKHNLIWNMTDSTEKPHILYECDRRACHDKCSMNCYHTTDITHAKNFECENGIWVERHSYPEVEV